MKQYRIILNGGTAEINVSVEDGGGEIVSTGLKELSIIEEEDNLYNAAVDGVESLVLALACAGVDIERPQIKTAVQTAVDAIGDNY
jgi:hypothetical protein